MNLPDKMGIITEGVSLSYDGHLVLGGVSLRLKKGAVITLLGPNGCGKTTLLKIINGLLRPSSGLVLSLHGSRYRAHWKNASYISSCPTRGKGCEKGMPGFEDGRSIPSDRQALYPNQWW